VFSELILDHFRHPRNAGELPGATAVVEVSNPVCGDVLQLAARIENARLAEVRFLCRGCTASIACGSLLTEKLAHHTLNQCRALTAEDLSEEFGLPAASEHAAQLAFDALQALLGKVVVS